MNNFITIVSGLPRSGTSMMMKMLEAGGLEVVTDDIRKPDEDNPKGYYEFEQVKQIKEDQSWLPKCEGKVVKMVSRLLLDLPEEYEYKIIFMRRAMEEILASQRKMLERSGKEAPSAEDDTEMSRLFNQHLQHVEQWMERQPNVDYIYVNYNATIQEPGKTAGKVIDFLDDNLDQSKMAGVVDTNLYRQRK
ncbi:MAG: sulfotransferase [Candidatus Marinimicrobia bacterium]|nr:sulfotransferase [Candidatus Neomarinimicrobiota bacterium]MCF7829238.1 sulfotransferase [Candidatus Neomarinimicrobiota bacterium]MCF7881109.1 sulfotransferase [Candidatus Neomarinimicrobiota bacterium]